MPYLLALDEGTTSARAVVFDERGRTLGNGRRALANRYPRAGWVEQDATEVWQAQREAAADALSAAGITGADLAAIGITNQRETTVVWDAHTGEPAGPAIVWQDRRTTPTCARLRGAGHEDSVRSKTGLLLDPYFSATKLHWLLEHRPRAAELAAAGRLRFGTMDSWLLWQLTDGAVHATDVSNAARTLLMNLHSLRWDAALLQLFGIPAGLLPAIHPSAHRFGTTTHFGGQVPISGLVGDQQAATFGQACFAPGMAKNTYGTGCFALMNIGNTPQQSQHRLLTTLGWQIGEEATYALEGAIFSAGASVEWLVQLGLVSSAAEAAELAATLPDNAGVYLVPAFAGLGAPQWDPGARGTLVGLTRGTTRAHLARAALEGMAFQSDDVLQAMQADSGLTLSELRVDGGASQSDFLMQFQADLSHTTLVRPANIESTAWGAAAMAGLAEGVFSGLDELAALHGTGERFAPQMPGHQRQALRSRWQAAVERSLRWAE